MRLLVHIGLHKTASTHLQHLLDDHREALLARGVFYRHQPNFRAHHRAAWRLLAGDASLLDGMLAEAALAGARDVICSSEDLEGVLHRPAVAELVTAAAERAGASVEWHVVLREPGASFASLYPQLSWHVYADLFWLFAEAMNKGGVYMPDPAPNWGGTPWWFYCFDQLRHLAGFEAATGATPFAHDYRDDRPFPGWRLLDRLGVMDVVERLPGATGQNRRLTPDAARAGFAQRIAEAGGAALLPMLDAATAIGFDAAPEAARLVGERFADSHARALERYGRW